MARRRTPRQDPRQLSLLDNLAEPVEPAVPPEAAALSDPSWTSHPGWEHTDFIADHAPCAFFLYHHEALEDVPDGPGAVVRALLTGLLALRSGPKAMRERAFTIFLGDCGPGYSIFACALGTIDGRTVSFLTPYMRNGAFWTIEVADCGTLLPKYRYDHGHVIEYADDDMAGTAYVDDQDRYGTGLVIHCRRTLPPDFIGKSRSVYGKLVDR